MTLKRHDKVQLRNLNKGDAIELSLLANNKSVSINLRDGFPNPYTLKDAEGFIQTVNSQDQITTFAIEYNGIYVGNIGFTIGTDVYRKSAELGYFLGEPYWNKGIMTESIKLITDFCFGHFDVVRIHTGVFEFNKSSQRVLEKCGYKKEGVFRKAVFKNKKYWDEIRYAKINI